MFPNLVIKVLDQFPKTSQKKETGRKMPKLEKALCQPQKRRQGEKKLEWVAQGGLEVSARPAFVKDYSRDTTCFMELHTCRF